MGYFILNQCKRPATTTNQVNGPRPDKTPNSSKTLIRRRMRRYVAVSIGNGKNEKTGIVSGTAGWYPQRDGQQRYWDGELWTGHFAPGVPPATPPMPATTAWPQQVLTQHPNQGPPPNNHLTWAWISTLLFCWPLGIPAIVYANRVNKKWTSGDVGGARQDSQRAQTFAIWSMCVGVVIWLSLIA